MKVRWGFLAIVVILVTVGILMLSSKQLSPTLQIVCEPLKYVGKSANNTKSLLESNYMDYICPRMEARVAIVMPFHGNDASQLYANIIRWKEPLFAPCLGDQPPLIDLYFSNCIGSLEQSRKTIDEALIPELRKCFKSVNFVYEDSVKALDHDRGSLEHLEAMLDRFTQTHDYFFIMEWDTFPVRDDWVNKLFLQVACGPDFWMKGSHARDANAHSVFYYGWHINGNAFYNVKNQDTLKLMKHILKSADPPIYDIAIDKYITRTPDNAKEVRDYRHLYMLTDFVYNMGPKPWATHQLRDNNPHVYLVHGRLINDNPGAKYEISW